MGFGGPPLFSSPCAFAVTAEVTRSCLTFTERLCVAILVGPARITTNKAINSCIPQALGVVNGETAGAGDIFLRDPERLLAGIERECEKCAARGLYYLLHASYLFLRFRFQRDDFPSAQDFELRFSRQMSPDILERPDFDAVDLQQDVVPLQAQRRGGGTLPD